MVRSFFGQGTPSRSRVHEPIIDSESFGNQGGNSPYDTRDVCKSANSNWFELARHPKEASELGRKPHTIVTLTRKLSYRKDNRAMRPIYGCPENYWESL